MDAHPLKVGLAVMGASLLIGIAQSFLPVNRAGGLMTALVEGLAIGLVLGTVLGAAVAAVIEVARLVARSRRPCSWIVTVALILGGDVLFVAAPSSHQLHPLASLGSVMFLVGVVLVPFKVG